MNAGRTSLSVLGAVMLGGLGLALSASAQLLDDKFFSQEPMPFEQSPLLMEPIVGCGKACRLKALYDLQIRAGMDMTQTGPNTLVGPGSFARTDRGPGNPPPPAATTDVLSYNLAIEVAPPALSLTGSNIMTVKSLVNNLTTFTFLLRWNYTVTSCTITDSVGSYTVTPSVPVTGGTTYARTFTLLRPINANQTFTVNVAYNGTIQTGIGLSPGSIVVRPQNNVTGAPPVLCTLSEPYYSATWWPCKDGDVRVLGDNADKATFQVAITCPDTLTGLSNGLLQGVDTLSGARKRYRWATNYQMTPYLLFLSISQYNQWQQTYSWAAGPEYLGGPSVPAGSMPVQFSIYPSVDSPANRAAWERTLLMLDTLRNSYGLYPFRNEKYGIYQFEFGGGQEHQTYTGQGGGGGTPFLEYITVHELGHQWWGDNITCRTWADIWLNEGFATYTEALWEERNGAAALQAAMVARKPADPANSVYCTDVANVGRIFDTSASYRKGSWVLHMLRGIVGDAAFVQTLANYRAAFQGSAALTSDFTAIASSTAGQDLSWFFNPWVYGNGAPVYTVGYENVVINSQRYLRLQVSQANQTASATTSFDMPIDTQITTAGGILNTRIRQNAASNWYLIPINAAATAVTLDPSDRVLNYGKSSVAYVAGPPKVIAVSPAPSATIAAASSPSAVTIGFSDNVAVSAANFTITRSPSTTPLPFTLTYSPTTQTATLGFATPLAAGTYNLVVSDAITANTYQLDGELNSPASALPSGNGLPGGQTTLSFTIAVPLCRGDFNSSGSVTVQDIFDFLAAWFSGSPSGDFNGINGLTVQDIFDFLSAWFTGC